MTKETQKKLRTTQRIVLRMIILTKTQVSKGYAAAHAVNDDADDDTHEFDHELEQDATEANLQDPSDQQENSHDVGSISSFSNRT